LSKRLVNINFELWSAVIADEIYITIDFRVGENLHKTGNEKTIQKPKAVRRSMNRMPWTFFIGITASFKGISQINYINRLHNLFVRGFKV
jgi:hypothetical protein